MGKGWPVRASGPGGRRRAPRMPRHFSWALPLGEWECPLSGLGPHGAPAKREARGSDFRWLKLGRGWLKLGRGVNPRIWP